MYSPNDNPRTESPQPLSVARKRSGVLRNRALQLGALLAGAAILALGVRFPQEILKLRENQAEIRRLQEENADLKKRRDERRERLKDLQENMDLYDLEIERSLQLFKPDQTIIHLPPKDAKDKAAPNTNAN